MFQISNVGPMFGQHHHFHHFNPGKSLNMQKIVFLKTAILEFMKY